MDLMYNRSFTSRNFNSNPLTIPNLQGDTYDYELVTWFDVEGVSSSPQITFNNDTATNYRQYRMEGDGSTASAHTTDATSTAGIYGNSYSYPTLSITRITGSSGEERYIDNICSLSAANTDTRVRKISSYWKNTANEITSIQLKKSASVTSNCHILLYRTLKTASQGNWEKVDELTWSAESTEKSFTGLDGDRDKKYKIVWSGDQNADLEINNDAGSNYIRQYLRNNNGTIQAGNTTTNTSIGLVINTEAIINAETGTKRLTTTTISQTTAAQQNEQAIWYNNTVTNITSLDLTPVASTTATATLYRMKSGTETSGVLPWELVEEVDVNTSDFTTGHTFSGLTGDSEKLYRLEFLGENTTGSRSLRVQFNGDTGTNYVTQTLFANITNVNAGSTTVDSGRLTFPEDGDRCYGQMILYPKSGSQRPSLGKQAFQENSVRVRADWYTNTATEITSMRVYMDAVDAITGKLKLWRLK